MTTKSMRETLNRATQFYCCGLSLFLRRFHSDLVQTWQFEHKQPEVLISLSHAALFPRKPIQTSLYHTLCPPHLPQLQPFPQAHFYLFACSPLHLRYYLRIKHLLADFLSPSKSISPEAMSVSLLSQ